MHMVPQTLSSIKKFIWWELRGTDGYLKPEYGYALMGYMQMRISISLLHQVYYEVLNDMGHHMDTLTW